MTKEELRIESTQTVQWECTPMIDRPTFVNGYIAGAEPREKRIAELEMTVGTLRTFSNEQATCIEKLEAQIEKMKADIKANIKVADQSNNFLMYQKLNSMLNQWEGKRG